jgi:hypothetical protein
MSRGAIIAALQITIADNDGALYPTAGIDSGGLHDTSYETSEHSQRGLAACPGCYPPVDDRPPET